MTGQDTGVFSQQYSGSNCSQLLEKKDMADSYDLFKGIGYGIWYSQRHIIHSFLVIPLGILILLAILYGFNVLLSDVFKIKFPASVLGMLINLIFLCILSSISSIASPNNNDKDWRNTIGNASHWILEHYLLVVKPLMNFTLKWINVFFIPSFVTLPLSDHITFIECLKIAAVFVVGGILLMFLNVYMILFFKMILQALGVYSFNLEKQDDKQEPDETKEIELFNLNWSTTHDITTIDVSSLRPIRTEPPRQHHNSPLSTNPFEDPEGPIEVQRVNTTPHIGPVSQTPENTPSEQQSSSESTSSPSQSISEQAHFDHLTPLAQKTAIFVTNYIDWFLYLTLFFAALPVYYIKSIHVMLPYHLALTVIAYYIALLIPLKWPKLRKFAHPILILTIEIIFVCFIGSLIYHSGAPSGFLKDLRYYKTGKTYLNLFNNKALWDNGQVVPPSELSKHFTAEPLWPGCGDFLSSLMDISIVSLSLPMFTHRRDFIKNFWVLMPPLVFSIALTFFCYPIICYKIGISSERSIGFIGRLVTLALGTPLISALGGSVSLMAVCTILSGICGVLIGDLFFNLLRIPSNDFVTRGVTLGINCGAIATAHLLNVDPRAASMSSLSFSVFGTIMIILASIGAVRDLIQSWVGL